MSRVGKKIIEIPAGVEIMIDKSKVQVKGSKGTLSMTVNREASVSMAENILSVANIGKSKKAPAIWGLTRALIQSMIKGVTEGYVKKLELQGVGFRMAIQGKKINMALGFSHPVIVDIPEGLEVKIEDNNVLTVSGIDKQAVGQFTADVRALKKVEPYKGKGFRYVGEHVRRKAGKKAASAK